HRSHSLADRWRLSILQIIGVGFRWLCVSVVVTGVGAWIWAGTGLIRHHRKTYLFIAATATLGSAFAVMLVNMLVNVLSFPNQNPTALHEGYPLLVLFAL